VYEDNVLDLVAQTIPVYHRQKKGDKQARQPVGHFGCTGCGSRPMSPARTYVTARITDMDLGENDPFQFIYSPQDAPYTEERTVLASRLRRSGHNKWVYFEGEAWNEQIVYVRGYWENGEFNHKSGPIVMGEHMPIHEQDDDDDTWWPEAAIQTFRPEAAGAYFDMEDVRQLTPMNPEQSRAYLKISALSSLNTPLTRAGWTLHGDGVAREPRPKKMRKAGVAEVHAHMEQAIREEERRLIDRAMQGRAINLDRLDRQEYTR